MRLRKTLLAIIACAIVSIPAAAQSGRDASWNEIRLYARLLGMTDSRSYDAALLDTVLASSWSPLRAAGALAIGQVGAPIGLAGAARLRGLLRDADQAVASNAAYALGLLVDSGSVPALGQALGGPPRVAREAAWALGESGSPARSVLTVALATPGADEARMIQLLLASAKLRPVPVAELRRYLRMTNRPAVQWAAAYAIARFRAPAGVRDLVALANDSAFMRLSAADGRAGQGVSLTPLAGRAVTAEAYVTHAAGRQRSRAEIARGLARQAAADSLADLAFPILSRYARDPHPHVRINAIRSLATYDARGREAVVAATRDADANVRIAAAQALGTVLDSALAGWAPLWDRDTSFTYRSSLLASAGRHGVRFPGAAAWGSSNDWRQRLAVLNHAAASRDTSVVRSAGTSALRDKDGRVRAVAYAIVAGNDTARHSDPVRQQIIAGLGDPDPYVRAAVTGALTRHATAAEVPMVIDAYLKGASDSTNDARVAAVTYLARAWRRDSAAFTDRQKQRLAGLRPSADPLERAAADSISVLQVLRSGTGPDRDPAWYQDVVRTYVIPALKGRPRRATISTTRGSIVLELFGAEAPLTVRNFVTLSRSGYYRGTGFHRVVPNFVAQDGDPRGDGSGGPGYAIRDEINPRRYERGALGMALSGPDTGGSQYFITHSPQPHLDGHYTVFGRVLSGYAALDAIVQGDRILSIAVQ
jgi:cyclophilin family peptidyl-prolyl cis-trans isomerase